MENDKPRKSPVRSAVRIVLLTLLVLIVSLVAWYFFRLYYGFRMVDAADKQAEALGGYIQIGNVNGDFYVNLQDTPIDDDQFSDLTRKLRWFPPPYLDQRHTISIYAANTQITDRSILGMQGMELRVLDLHGTAITDASIPTITTFPLWLLDLNGTKVSDASVPAIGKMRLLRLEVGNSNITQQGKEKLKMLLPRARSVYGD